MSVDERRERFRPSLMLECGGSVEGATAGSSLSNMKELRPGSVGKSKTRILFACDPW
jgi:hypothetical protein